MLDQLVGSPMSLHGDLSCVAYFFSRWPPKAERVDLRPSFSETEKKPATLRLVTALLGLGLKWTNSSSSESPRPIQDFRQYWSITSWRAVPISA